LITGHEAILFFWNRSALESMSSVKTRSRWRATLLIPIRTTRHSDQDHETAGRLGVEYATSERGTPLLKDCLARLDCTLVATHEGGDHTLFVGRVEQANTGTGRPLLFYQGKFGGLADRAT
jgi:flavin reductase (DIM6/NTAB) family NADH-FMN oxidoreductase RutF